MSRWLIGISGARPEVLALCPTERVKFISLGWAMVIASGTAGVGVWFALVSFLGLSGIVAAPAAIAFGCVMLGIERWMADMPKGGGFPQLAQVIPRLLTGLLLSVLVATPLVLRVFESEIDSQVVITQEQNYNAYLRSVAQSAIAQQVQARRAQVDQLQAAITAHKPGYKQAEEALPSAQEQLGAATAQLNQLQNAFEAANASDNGLLVRLHALRQLESGNSTVSAAVFLLVALFFMIEELPVTIRLLQQPGNYERILAEAQRSELLTARRVLLGEGQPSLPVSLVSTRDYSGRDPLDAELERVWNSAIGQRRPNEGADHLDATEPELEPAESYEHARHEDVALAMLDDARTSDWPTPPNGIPLRWDDYDAGDP